MFLMKKMKPSGTCFDSVVEEQNSPLKKVSLWYVDYFRLISFFF